MNLIEKVYAEMATDADGNGKQAAILEQGKRSRGKLVENQ